MPSLRCLPLVLLLAFAGCGGGEESGSSGGSEKAAPPEPAALAGQWWQWAAGAPEGEDPVTDRTGARCADRQPDDVFFLAGTFGGKASRKCTVPADTPVFFPVLNVVCPVEGDAKATVRECGKGVKAAKTAVRVDGKTVEAEYVESEPFTLEADPKSPLVESGGEAVAVGWHVLLDPLPAGEHDVRFAGRGGDFAVAIRYRLTAE